MKKIVVASTHKSAGKTSLIVGLAKASKGDFAYVKPFGDRLLYRKKRLWDYDAALMAKIFDIKESPEEMSIGFEHAKLRFIYDEKSIKEKVIEKAGEVSKDKKVLFVEGGSDIKYGASVHLDSLSVLRYLDAGLVLVVGGDEYSVLDDIVFVKEYIDSTKLKFEGIIINNIRDVEDFKATHLDTIKKAGVDILGIIPHRPELTHISVRLLVDRMFARVISGEGGLDKVVKNVFVGAMSVSSALQDPLFEKEGKLIITGGDRSDMVLAALESDTSCIVLTNNILPPANIISKAEGANVPLLLVPWDTYYTTMQVERLEPLLTAEDAEKVAFLENLIKENVDTSKILGE